MKYMCHRQVKISELVSKVQNTMDFDIEHVNSTAIGTTAENEPAGSHFYQELHNSALLLTASFLQSF